MQRTAHYERPPEMYGPPADPHDRDSYSRDGYDRGRYGYEDYDAEPYDSARGRPRREPEPPRGSEPSRFGERSYEEQRARREDRARTLATVIHLFSGLIATVFVLHIVFVLAGANQNSGIVSFVYSTAKIFVFGFGDVFTPDDATFGLVLNYGLAAIVYLVLGRVVAGALRRR